MQPTSRWTVFGKYVVDCLRTESSLDRDDLAGCTALGVSDQQSVPAPAPAMLKNTASKKHTTFSYTYDALYNNKQFSFQCLKVVSVCDSNNICDSGLLNDPCQQSTDAK